MRKICPQCKGVVERQLLCPSCGVQLVEISDRSQSLLRRSEVEAIPLPGMATRFAAGWLLALGAYFALRHLHLALLVTLGDSESSLPAAWDNGDLGLMLIGVLSGSLLAGAGNPRGMAAGAALGLFYALALIGAGLGLGHWPQSVVLYFGWLALTVVGAAGGRCGRQVWPPLSDLHARVKAAAISAEPTIPISTPARRPVPIAWFRVLGGAALSIGCTVWAGQIRDFVILTSGGKFSVDSRLQLDMATWVISALAMMIGGVFAGASTRAGARHGLLVGVLAAVGVFVVHSSVLNQGLPAERFFDAVIGLPEATADTPMRIGLFLLTNAVGLGTFGGWFGAALLPRLIPGSDKLDRAAI
jgi:hypothetical protein